MLFSESAEIAERARTARLVLTHFSTRLDDPESGLAACRNIFDRIWSAHDGMVMIMRYPKGNEPAETVRRDAWQSVTVTDEEKRSAEQAE